MGNISDKSNIIPMCFCWDNFYYSEKYWHLDDQLRYKHIQMLFKIKAPSGAVELILKATDIEMFSID